jgi:hypothetical protein
LARGNDSRRKQPELWRVKMIAIDIPMPEKCYDCPCLHVMFGDKYCPASGMHLNVTPNTEGRPRCCPLTDLPDGLYQVQGEEIWKYHGKGEKR